MYRTRKSSHTQSALLASAVNPLTFPQVDVNNVEGICKQKLRLDSEAVLGGDNQQALAVAVTQLQRSYEEAAAQGGDPPVLDPVADLKLNQLEVVDGVRERQRLMQVCTCTDCLYTSLLHVCPLLQDVNPC